MATPIELVSGLELYSRSEPSCVLFSSLSNLSIVSDIASVESEVGSDGLPSGRVVVHDSSATFGAGTGFSNKTSPYSFPLNTLPDFTVVLEVVSTGQSAETLLRWGEVELVLTEGTMDTLNRLGLSIPSTRPASRIVILRANSGGFGLSATLDEGVFATGTNHFASGSIQTEVDDPITSSWAIGFDGRQLFEGPESWTRGSADWLQLSRTSNGVLLEQNILDPVSDWIDTSAVSDVAISNLPPIGVGETGSVIFSPESGSEQVDEIVTSPSVEVNPGDSYRMSTLAQSLDTVSPSSTVSIMVVYRRADGSIVSSQNVDTSATGGAQPVYFENWFMLTGTSVAPAEAYTAEMVISADYNATTEAWSATGMKFANETLVNASSTEVIGNYGDPILVDGAEFLQVDAVFRSGIPQKSTGGYASSNFEMRYYNSVGTLLSAQSVGFHGGASVPNEVFNDSALLNVPTGSVTAKLFVELSGSQTGGWLFEDLSVYRADQIGAAGVSFYTSGQQPVPISAGEEASFSAFVRSDVAFTMKLEWLDGVGATLSTSTGATLIQELADSPWGLYEFISVAPASAASFIPSVEVTGPEPFGETRVALPSVRSRSGGPFDPVNFELLDQFSSNSVPFITQEVDTTLVLGDENFGGAQVKGLAVFNEYFDDAKILEVVDAAMGRERQSYAMGSLTLTPSATSITNVVWSNA